MYSKYILLILCFLSVAVCKQFRCDYKYYGQADGWLKYHEIPANWAEARLRCQLEGAKLASPLVHIKEAMRDLMNKKSPNTTCGVFTGIHSFFTKGDYHSIEGIPLSQISHTWTNGEPDNYKDRENCIFMTAEGRLADVDCADAYPYLCYKASASLVITSCGTVDPEYTLYPETGSCYKFHRVPRTWSRAYTACAAEGAHLAIINNQDEFNIIKRIYSQNPAGSMVGTFTKDYAFIGFHDWGHHDAWLTIHGETLKEAGFDRFASGRPDNATTGRFCGGVYRNGYLIDMWCENVYAFICEKLPGSLNCNDDDDSY